MQLPESVFWEPWCNARDTRLGELVSPLRVKDITLYGRDWNRCGWCLGWCHRLAFLPVRDIYEVDVPRVILTTEDQNPKQRTAALQAEVRQMHQDLGMTPHRLSIVTVLPSDLAKAVRQYKDVVGIVSSVTWRIREHETGLSEGRKRLRDQFGNKAVVIRSHRAEVATQTITLQHDGELDVALRDATTLPRLRYAGGYCYVPPED